MAVTLAEDFFSRDASNSAILVKAFRQKENDGVVRATVRHFNRYVDGLSQLTNVDQPTRNEMLLLWYEDCVRRADLRLKPIFERLELPYHEYQDLMMHRLRKARLHGSIMEKMRS